MKLHKFIATTIREYLNEQENIGNNLNENLSKPQSKKSNLNSELWTLVNSNFFMNWSNGWSDVLLDENNEPAIFYRGITLYKDEKVDWNFNKSFFTRDKSYAQQYAKNYEDGSFNEELVFSFFLKSKFTMNIENHLRGIGICTNWIKTKYKIFQSEFKDYKKFLSDFNRADIITGDEDGSDNFSYDVKDNANVLTLKKLSQIVNT